MVVRRRYYFLPLPERVLFALFLLALFVFSVLWFLVFQLYAAFHDSLFAALLSWFFVVFFFYFFVRYLRRVPAYFREYQLERHLMLASRRAGVGDESTWRAPRVLGSYEADGYRYFVVAALDASYDLLTAAAKSYAALTGWQLVELVPVHTRWAQVQLAYLPAFRPVLPPVGAWAMGSVPISDPPSAHTLVIGRTGAGKSVLLRSLVFRYLSSSFRVFIVDPKRVDLVKFAAYAERYASEPAEVLSLLDDVIRDINDTFAELQRLGVYSVHPHKVLVIDELMLLATDKDQAARLDRILRLGRAAGWLVTAATQTPQKERMPIRDHFGLYFVLPIDVSSALTVLPMTPSDFAPYVSRWAPGVAYVYPFSSLPGAYPVDLNRDVGVVYVSPRS